MPVHITCTSFHLIALVVVFYRIGCHSFSVEGQLHCFYFFTFINNASKKSCTSLFMHFFVSISEDGVLKVELLRLRVWKLIIFIGASYVFSKELGQCIFLPSWIKVAICLKAIKGFFQGKSNFDTLKNIDNVAQSGKCLVCGHSGHIQEPWNGCHTLVRWRGEGVTLLSVAACSHWDQGRSSTVSSVL